MAQILLVEDSADLVNAIKWGLSQYEVTSVSSIKQARERASQSHFDLVLLDINLPDGNGVQFWAELKSSEGYKNTPALFISGRDDFGDKVLAFSLGAEDYITKPFDVRELSLRVNRRLGANMPTHSGKDTDVVVKGALKLIKSKYEAFTVMAGVESRLDLTPFEFKLLLFFMTNEGTVYSRTSLIEKLWGGEIHVFDRTVDAHISKVRKKIKSSGYTISSIYSVGYVFRSAKIKHTSSLSDKIA
ncbi:MAG: response regulator transcription factor [Oligoflexia bacterium]|nr:response regulator transcription factor [Oligoflexia bacterium]